MWQCTMKELGKESPKLRSCSSATMETSDSQTIRSQMKPRLRRSQNPIAICKNNASFTLAMRLNHICANNLQTGTCPFHLMITVNTCPLGEGGSPKGRGWIRLAEAESVKLRISRVCLFYIQILTITAIHPAALPRPFSKGLHA